MKIFKKLLEKVDFIKDGDHLSIKNIQIFSALRELDLIYIFFRIKLYKNIFFVLFDFIFFHLCHLQVIALSGYLNLYLRNTLFDR